MITSDQDTIENVRAIEKLVLPRLDGGGIIEISGDHGTGKSTALAAIQAAVRGEGKLTLRDGQDRGGLTFHGAKITVTAGSTRHRGELEVESIEGKFSLRDLIDPGIKDDDRADAASIKALVELSGAKADASLFESIAPEPIKDKADDLVTLAAKLKATWEQTARDAEAAAALAMDKAKRESPPEGSVLTGAVDPASLTQEHRAAASRLDRLIGEDEAAAKAAERNADIVAKLAEIDIEAIHVELGKRSRAATTAKLVVEAATEDVKQLRAKLAEAEAYLAEKSRAAADAIRAEKESERELGAAEDLRDALQSSVPPRVEPDAIAEAKREAEELEMRIAANAIVRKNIEQQRKAAEFFAAADGHNQKAKKYRDAAGGIDGVLSAVVAGMGCPLTVKDGRLVADIGEGPELFRRLSHGERTLLSIDVALAILPESGVLVVDQETYAGLHEADVQRIAEKARERGIVVLSAVLREGAKLGAEVVA